jgi:PAS domain S-box-containing protein
MSAPAASSVGRDGLARRLRRIQQLTRTGSWDWDIAAGELAWSPEVFDIFALQAGACRPTYDLFLAHVHPDDRKEVKRRLDLARSGRGPYDLQHRIVRGDGVVRFVRQQGEAELDPGGRVVALFGVVQDVTETRQAQIASRRSQEMLASMLRISPEAILLCDADGRVLAISAGAEAMFGYCNAEIAGHRVERLMPPRFRIGHVRYVAEFSAGQAASLRMHERTQILGLRKDGTEFPAEASLAKFQTEDGATLLTIVRDLSERRAAEATLIEAREQAERANAAKSTFLANMSHEIRTPLNGVLGVAGALALTDLTPKQAQMVRLIETSGRALQGLLGDILDLAKVDAGRMQLRNAPFALDRLLEDTVALFQASAAEHEVALSLSVDRAACATYIGDELRIRQVLSNLLSNAVKFTARGRIEVIARVRPTADPDLSHVSFEVRDTGVGFAPELAARLFERFEQADGSITRRYGGTGLGLAISKALVELMEGEISAEGRPGRGATFVFTIPLAHDVVGDPRLVSREPPVVGEQGQVSVLLAEDHPVNRMAVEYILETLPVSVVSVSDGAQAVEAARGRRFDLILMDMQMPVMDGLTAIREIRREEGACARPPSHICVLTANAFEEHRQHAGAAGADAFLTKPVQVRDLIDLVSNLAGAP